MSTQLILYPQSYKGISTPLGNLQFLVDGIYFLTLDSSSPSYSTSLGIDAHLYATPPTIINTWYRWRNVASGTAAYPVQTSNNLVMNAVTPSSNSGVYQKLSNLTVGASYTLTVNMTAIAAGGLINLQAFNLSTNSLIASTFTGSASSQATLTFTAQNTNDVVAITYYNTSATNLTISSLSIVATGTSPSQIYAGVEDGQVICDLYQEEDIPLTLSIDDFKNVAEKVQSYSKDFNLPATKRNNRIFNNMFEVTRADDGLIFNPYVRTKCVLKQDGFILFEGYLRLINVKDDNGEISYNVNLYSEVIALADTLKEKTFSDLDFSELAHNYTYSNIRNSWQGILALTNPLPVGTFAGTAGASTTGVLKYPFIDWTHQYTPDASGNPVLPNLESTFRPCIEVKYLIDRIFAASGFTYTSDFFNEAFFGKLFMDFNWGGDVAPTVINTSGLGHIDANQTATTSYVAIQTNDNTYDAEMGYSGGVYTASQDTQLYDIYYEYLYNVSGAGAWTWEIVWQWYHAATGVTTTHNLNTHSGTGSTTGWFQLTSGSVTLTLMSGDTLTPMFKSASAASHTITLFAWNGYGVGITYASTSSPSIATDTILQTLRGELGQWDFLKGIMTMFNLVSMVDENNPDNILIEPYAEIFINNSNSKRVDWTDKVDVSQMDLVPLTDLNKNTVFQFVEDEDDYVFRQFKNTTSGSLYGAKYWDASGLTILQGTKEIIAEPFAATVSKPLMSQYPDFVVPSIYAMGDDGTTEGFDNSPRIFYNNYVPNYPNPSLASCTYYVPAQNGGGATGAEDEFLQFSHLSAIPTVVTVPPDPADTVDFVFSSHQLCQPIGASPVNNLFNTYWLPYFAELYNADTRTMTLKVNLSPADVARFKFYDTVFIKNRAFRVNKIQYKPNSLATVEFILIP
jgi:hypothetical protein